MLYFLSLSQYEWEIGVNDIILPVIKFFDTMVLKQLQSYASIFFSFRRLTNDLRNLKHISRKLQQLTFLRNRASRSHQAQVSKSKCPFLPFFFLLQDLNMSGCDLKFLEKFYQSHTWSLIANGNRRSIMRRSWSNEAKHPDTGMSSGWMTWQHDIWASPEHLRWRRVTSGSMSWKQAQWHMESSLQTE